MTTSYLFTYYTLKSQVYLSSCMSIKTGLFFILSFCCIITLISGITDHYCIMENLKEIRRKYTQKIMKILRTASLGSSFTGSYKKECTVIFITISAWCQSSRIFQCNGFRK